MSIELPFKTRTIVWSNEYFKNQTRNEAQCPVCKTWFTYYGYNFGGVKQHIRKWASKEATAVALGEIKKMKHLDFWKDNNRTVDAIPKNREWKL